MRCDTSRFSTSETPAAAVSKGRAKSLALLPAGALLVDAFSAHSFGNARGETLEVLMDTGCSPATPISYDLVLPPTHRHRQIDMCCYATGVVLQQLHLTVPVEER